MSKMQKKTLADVQAGDNVIIQRKAGRREVKPVTRVTPTQIIIGEERFKKADGYKIGEKYSLYGASPRTWINVWTEEIEKDYIIHKIIYKESRLRELSLETLQQMVAMIEGGAK